MVIVLVHRLGHGVNIRKSRRGPHDCQRKSDREKSRLLSNWRPHSGLNRRATRERTSELKRFRCRQDVAARTLPPFLNAGLSLKSGDDTYCTVSNNYPTFWHAL